MASMYDINRLRQMSLFEPMQMTPVGPYQTRHAGEGMQVGGEIAPRTSTPRGVGEGMQTDYRPIPELMQATRGLGGIFGQQEPKSQDLDLIGMVNKIYSPETTSRDKYNQLLGSFPERNQPSWARKLVAGGMGLDARRRQGGDPLATMETAMYAPYMRDVSAWKEQVEPTYKAAELENRANINERTL